MRVDHITSRSETRDVIDENLINFVSCIGFIPVLVPNTLLSINKSSTLDISLLECWLKNIKAEAIILSGGNYIGQYPQRDQTELKLIDYALKKKIPLLGICRGMQMLAYWSGTNLSPIKGHVGKRLKLVGEINHEVNCFHEFVVSSCPDDFSIIAKCTEDSIQAIKHKYLDWEGWMWHPEREAEFNKYDINRLKNLFN